VIFGKIRHIHFVGIGGAGMNGLAEIMLNMGFRVTGSDLIRSGVTKHLEELGAEISYNHEAHNVDGSDVVIFSAAVPASNPELIEAHRLRIPVIRRAQMLAELMRLKYAICISGTHGKTTTTSMIGQVLTFAEYDPTIVVGGKVKSLRSHVRLGTGDYIVAEADEFDRSFLTLLPTIAIVTTIEHEHRDIYPEFESLKQAFSEFILKVPFYGFVVACIEDRAVREILPQIERRVITYGEHPDAEYQPDDIQFNHFTSTFMVKRRGTSLGYFTINVPGMHNIKNAIAAIATGIELDVPLEQIRESFKGFSGVFRRFELKDEIDNVMVIDDYAHHPTEVRASLNAARTGWKDRRVIAIFQPHLFTRTRDFCDDFGGSFNDADTAIITEIYPAREKPIEGVSGKLIADSAQKKGHPDIRYIPGKKDVIDQVSELVKSGDIIITLGAGDVWDISERIILKLKKKQTNY